LLGSSYRPLHILAIGLPILLLVYVGIRKISVGSPQRFWGLLASGSFLAPVLIFSVEIIGILILIIIGAVWLSNQPEMLSNLRDLAESMQQMETTPTDIQSMLTPYVTRPGVILAAFAFAALFVPLVEELLKPIGVWFLVGSAFTPRAGSPPVCCAARAMPSSKAWGLRTAAICGLDWWLPAWEQLQSTFSPLPSPVGPWQLPGRKIVIFFSAPSICSTSWYMGCGTHLP